MNHFLTAIVGLLVAMFLCIFAVGHGDLPSWTEGQRVVSSLIMGCAFIVPLFIGYLEGAFSDQLPYSHK